MGARYLLPSRQWPLKKRGHFVPALVVEFRGTPSQKKTTTAILEARSSGLRRLQSRLPQEARNNSPAVRRFGKPPARASVSRACAVWPFGSSSCNKSAGDSSDCSSRTGTQTWPGPYKKQGMASGTQTEMETALKPMNNKPCMSRGAGGDRGTKQTIIMSWMLGSLSRGKVRHEP